MEYGTGGPGASGKNGSEREPSRVESMRDAAEKYSRDVNDMLQRARELLATYPGFALAGAAAAGFLFARVAARRRRR